MTKYKHFVFDGSWYIQLNKWDPQLSWGVRHTNDNIDNNNNNEEEEVVGKKEGGGRGDMKEKDVKEEEEESEKDHNSHI